MSAKIEVQPIRGEFRLFVTDLEKGETYEKEGTNIIVNSGRDQMLRLLFGLAASTPAISLTVGACSTAATVNDTRLTYELIGNPTRKPLVSAISGGVLSASDIQNETITISSVTYYKKLVCQATWDSTDPNNGNQFGEYGLNTSITNPATPTSTSGVLINHYVDPNPTVKSAGNAITAQITIRF